MTKFREQAGYVGLPVSSRVRKELGSHPPILTSRKLNKPKNQHFFLGPFEKGSHGANSCPPKLERQTSRYRES